MISKNCSRNIWIGWRPSISPSHATSTSPSATAVHKMTPDQVIELHSSATYVVYFLGFVPGFAYLGELPPALVTSRLATPRRSVPRGSVGIAGNQTGIYPVSTP